MLLARRASYKVKTVPTKQFQRKSWKNKFSRYSMHARVQGQSIFMVCIVNCSSGHRAAEGKVSKGCSIPLRYPISVLLVSRSLNCVHKLERVFPHWTRGQCHCMASTWKHTPRLPSVVEFLCTANVRSGSNEKIPWGQGQQVGLSNG